MSDSAPSFEFIFRGMLAEIIDNFKGKADVNSLFSGQPYPFIKDWIQDNPDKCFLKKGRKTENVMGIMRSVFYAWALGFGVLYDKKGSNFGLVDDLCGEIMDSDDCVFKILSGSPNYNNYMSFRASIYLANRYDQNRREMLSDYYLIDEIQLNLTVYGSDGDPLLNKFIKDMKDRANFMLNGYDRFGRILDVEKPISIVERAIILKEFRNLRQLLQEEDTVEEQALNLLKKMPPTQFERFSLELIKIYVNGVDNDITHLGGRHDGGLDGLVVIKNNFGRFEKNYIQCKRYTDKTIGSPDVQGFSGAMDGVKASRGLFLTTSKFSKSAHEYVEGLSHKSIQLIEGYDIIKIMKENLFGFKKTEPILTLDKLFFDRFMN